MPKLLTRDKVITMLRKRQGDKTQIEFAAELGITQGFLSEIYKGTRNPSDKVLAALGLAEETAYREETDQPA